MPSNLPPSHVVLPLAQTNIALSYEAFMGEGTVPVTAETGINVLRVIDAILESNGKPVPVL
ncbi:MAG TPA: hypothetical protein PLG27_03165 [Candidatus Latescibacteria bacterium]|nr:hypothetical protein [Candidatus Latescibacterota bacterium]